MNQNFSQPTKEHLRKFYERCERDYRRAHRNARMLRIGVALLVVGAFFLGWLLGSGGF